MSVKGEHSSPKVRRQNTMTPIQFELFKQQISQLTPQQLKALRGEINNTLEDSSSTLVTDEELNLISSLFS